MSATSWSLDTAIQCTACFRSAARANYHSNFQKRALAQINLFRFGPRKPLLSNLKVAVEITYVKLSEFFWNTLSAAWVH